MQALAKPLGIRIELTGDLVEALKCGGVPHQLAPMSFELSFDRAHVIEFQCVLFFRFLQDQEGGVCLGTFRFIFFVKPLEFRFDKLQSLADRIDIAAYGFGPVIQAYDLLGLVPVLAFRTVAFERVLGVPPADLGERLLNESRLLRRIAKRFFLFNDLCRESLLDFYRFSQLFFKTLDGRRKVPSLGSEKLAEQNTEFFLKDDIAACLRGLTSK